MPFVRMLTLAVLTALLLARPAGAAEVVKPPTQDWPFSGIFGTYDRMSAQRGLQVYQQVCASCHALSYVAFRNLADLGYSEEQVTALAEQYFVTDGPDDTGQMYERPASGADRFPAPFPNEEAARFANNGAYPPDLSLITQARPYGPDYVYAFLIGYEEPPEGVEVMPGMYWNEYYPGHQVAMPNMLFEGGIVYDDGTEATAAQQAWDVVNFLMWTAEPHMEERKNTGVKVMVFLIVFSGLMYAVKRRVWSDVH